ncbi:MAG: hypothetical protein JHC84_04845 [Solirubrobacteraceae bacterium]|nr:hypothetical protein [Solirubrobacteraceae bacterium]
MRRSLTTLTLAATMVLVAASTALASAQGHDGGEGTYGLTNDKVVTNFGFALIAFFPLFIFTMSMIQLTLDKRKQRRKQAEKARSTSAHWAGGW